MKRLFQIRNWSIRTKLILLFLLLVLIPTTLVAVLSVNQVQTGDIYLVDEDGFYLVHSTSTGQMGLINGETLTIATDTLGNSFNELKASPEESLARADDTLEAVVGLEKVSFDSLHPERH